MKLRLCTHHDTSKIHVAYVTTEAMLTNGGWLPIEGATFTSMKDGVDALKQMLPGKWKWAKPSGNCISNAVMQCNAHMLCKHFRSVRRTAIGCFQIFEKGKHTAEPTLKRRKNSILNWEDDAKLRSAIQMGGKPGAVLVELTASASKKLKAAGEDPLSKKHKRKAGGLKCA